MTSCHLLRSCTTFRNSTFEQIKLKMITISLLGVRNIVMRSACASCRHKGRTLFARSMATDTVADIKNKPIEFLSSPAAKMGVRQTHRNDTDMLWYQPYVVSLSLAVFLIYFCVLREENDIDELLSKDLTETLPGFEKKQLLQAYDYQKQNGMDVSMIEKRLKEIILEEKTTSKQQV